MISGLLAKLNITMPVCPAVPPLPLNCNSLSWGCHFEFYESFIRWVPLVLKLSGLCTCLKWIELVSAHYTGGQNTSYVAENVWKRQGHLYFFFVLLERREWSLGCSAAFKELQCADYSLNSSLRVFDIWLHISCGCQSELFSIIFFFVISFVMPLLCAWRIQAKLSYCSCRQPQICFTGTGFTLLSLCALRKTDIVHFGQTFLSLTLVKGWFDLTASQK